MKTTGKPVSAVAALLTAGSMGLMGYSFQAHSGSIFRTAPVAPGIVQPLEVKPVAVQPITDGTDAASRARSWFDAQTGKFCLGMEIKKACR